MCSNASITEILGINDKNLVILGNEKEKIKPMDLIAREHCVSPTSVARILRSTVKIGEEKIIFLGFYQ